MTALDPAQILNRISELVQAREFAEARRLSRLLWLDLKPVGDADLVLRGWARFYELKCSYELGDHRAAFELMTSPPGVPFSIGATNLAWMYSVSAELAMHLGLPHEVVRFANLCLELRAGTADPVSRAQCAQTACALLGKLQRDDLSVPFAHALLDLWREAPAERLLLAGVRFLLAAGAALSPSDHRRIAALLPALARLHDDAFSGEAIELIGAIERARWLDAALSTPEREHRQQVAALTEACRRGDTGAVRVLLDAGADVDGRDGCDRTPLIHAAFQGNADVVRLLLSRGASAQAENIQRRTALILAADQGHAECVRALLDAEAKRAAAGLPKGWDHEGIHDQTALHVASWQGHLEVVQLLLEVGVDLRVRDATGNTALTLTATEDQPEIVAALIAAGAELDGTTPRGHTPLMKAAMEGRTRVVELLLALGADPNRRDRHRQSAADWAEREGHDDIAARLRGAMKGAKRRAQATLEPAGMRAIRERSRRF